MRKLIYIVTLVSIIFTGCRPSSPQKSNATLSFYIVHEEKIDGGRYIDSPMCPHLGYIGTTPDLVLTRLIAVNPTNGPAYESPPIPRLNITMYPEDAKKLSALSNQTVGKQLLIMLDDKPLMAPRVASPFYTESFDITLGQHDDKTFFENEFKKLVQ